jgi:hypothetical protein
LAQKFCLAEECEPNTIGGRPSYLTKTDETAFEILIEFANSERISLTTEKIMLEGQNLKVIRYRKALSMTIDFKLVPLIQKLSHII